MIRMLAAVLLWIPAYVLHAVLWLLGWPVTLVLALLGERAVERRLGVLSRGREIAVWRYPWAWLWSNEEDGVEGPVEAPHHPSTQRWIERTSDWPRWRRIVSWSAARNSVANERMLWEPVELYGEWDNGTWSSPDVQWVGASTHPHEQWKAQIYRTPGAWSPTRWFWCLWSPTRWLWCLTRKGWRAGLWIRRLRDRLDPGAGYVEIRLGWKLMPAPARDGERYAGLGLQAKRRGCAAVGGGL